MPMLTAEVLNWFLNITHRRASKGNLIVCSSTSFLRVGLSSYWSLSVCLTSQSGRLLLQWSELVSVHLACSSGETAWASHTSQQAVNQSPNTKKLVNKSSCILLCADAKFNCSCIFLLLVSCLQSACKSALPSFSQTRLSVVRNSWRTPLEFSLSWNFQDGCIFSSILMLRSAREGMSFCLGTTNMVTI